MPLAATIENRNVYLAQGKKSATVNVCHASNQRGDYEFIVRVSKPPEVTEADVAGHAHPALASGTRRVSLERGSITRLVWG